MSPDELAASAVSGESVPQSLSPELQALWYTKAGDWERAHEIAQDIPSAAGSWIHALLHLIEGDVGNAGYWFRQAGKPPRRQGQTESLWDEIAAELCG